MPHHPTFPRAHTNSGVTFDADSRQLGFTATRLGTFALVQRKARLAPFTRWSLRPSGGLGEGSALLRIEVGEAQQQAAI